MLTSYQTSGNSAQHKISIHTNCNVIPSHCANPDIRAQRAEPNLRERLEPLRPTPWARPREGPGLQRAGVLIAPTA